VKIVIVDDEPLSLCRLERLLKELGECDIVKASDAKAALEACKEECFDVAFLDINLPDMSGVELAEKILMVSPDIKIVFQTAYDKYTLDAFDVGAVGYLLKPYSKEQLLLTLRRVQKNSPKKPPTFLVRDENEYLKVETYDIYYVEAELTQCVIRTKELFLYYPKKISQMEEVLGDFDFFRIHRSILVNTKKIKKISTVEQSRLLFSFFDINDKVESSKDGAKLFRQKYGAI